MDKSIAKDIDKLREVKVFLCICATGKSYLASVDSRFVDVDQEEAIYKFDYDENMSQDKFSQMQGHGVIVRHDSEEYIHERVLEHIKNGKIVLSATHKHMLKFLEEQKIPYVIIQYSEDKVDYFKNRMRQRGNSEDFIEAMIGGGRRGEAYKRHKSNQYATAVLDIYENEYLSDIMWKIFGQPIPSSKSARKDFKLNLNDLNLNCQIIDKAFIFYDLDEKYKSKAYDCLSKILDCDDLKNKFLEVYKVLFFGDGDKLKELWKIKQTQDLFGNNASAFITNLMILLAMPIQKSKMKEMKFSRSQINRHKSRVKECFLNDIENRDYKGIRISQMLWASYFINCKIIEVGILQFEYDEVIDKIKIHIPRMPKLDFKKVKQSIANSKKEVKRYFHFDDKQYICNSWLLSKQLTPILKEKSNIKKFQTLFEINEGEDCVGDILNFVYNLNSCENFSQLAQKSFLQRKIKTQLMKGTIFRLGCGELI